MVVAMVAMDVMQSAIDQVVGVVAVGNGRMTATGTVNMFELMTG